MNRVLVAAVVVLAALLASAEERANRFESVTAGFQLDKPEAWRFASLEQVSRNRATVRMKDEELQQFVRERASAPLVVLMKHEEPYDALNPSFQVILRPLPPELAKATPKQILEIIVPTLEKGFKDFALEGTIREFELSGRSAAELTARYSVANPEGRVFPTRTRMIVVPRGEFMFLMSASAPPDGPDSSKQAFDAIVASIQVTD